MKFKALFLTVMALCLFASFSRCEDECGDCQMLVNGVCKHCYEVQRECVVDLCVPPDMSSEQIEELKKAQEGVANSEHSLGSEHFNQKQYEKAKLWFRRAAESGDSTSCFIFGSFLAGALAKNEIVHSLRGDVPQRHIDDKEAEKWLLRAANAGHNCAKNLLAYLYVRMGRYSEAQYWARRCLQEDHHQDSSREALRQMGLSH